MGTTAHSGHTYPSTVSVMGINGTPYRRAAYCVPQGNALHPFVKALGIRKAVVLTVMCILFVGKESKYKILTTIQYWLGGELRGRKKKGFYNNLRSPCWNSGSSMWAEIKYLLEPLSLTPKVDLKRYCGVRSQNQELYTLLSDADTWADVLKKTI